MKGDNYSGFVYWNKNGIVFSEDEKELIKENVLRILTTRKGERVGEPEFGSRVKDFLFMPQMYVDNLLDEIKYSVERFEPRVTVNTCTITPGQEQEDIINIRLEMTINTPEGKEIIKTEVEV